MVAAYWFYWICCCPGRWQKQLSENSSYDSALLIILFLKFIWKGTKYSTVTSAQILILLITVKTLFHRNTCLLDLCLFLCSIILTSCLLISFFSFVFFSTAFLVISTAVSFLLSPIAYNLSPITVPLSLTTTICPNWLQVMAPNNCIH